MLPSDYELTSHLLHLQKFPPDVTVSGKAIVAFLEEA
jgi:hypothetical protein